MQDADFQTLAAAKWKQADTNFFAMDRSLGRLPASTE
jgi:hypothetical protein